MSDSESYSLELTEKAQNNLAKINKREADRISEKLTWIADNIHEIPHFAMVGNWAGHFRYKIGDYRAIYHLDHATKVMTVVAIGHRKDVYE